jgi:hypothetical protein
VTITQVTAAQRETDRERGPSVRAKPRMKWFTGIVTNLCRRMQIGQRHEHPAKVVFTIVWRLPVGNPPFLLRLQCVGLVKR